MKNESISLFKKNIIAVTTLVLLSFVVYYNLPNSYFQQDEWHSFGYYIYLQSLPLTDFLKNMLSSGPLAHFTPLSLLFKMTIFNLFALNAQYYFYISILLHSLVVICVYALMFILTGSFFGSLFAASFFAVNASSYQAVTWLGTFEGVELSTLFGLLSIIAYLKLLKKLFWPGFFILLSLLCRENGLIFLLILVFFILLYEKDKIQTKLLSLVKISWGLFVYLGLKFSYIFTNVSAENISVSNNQFSIGNSVTYNFIVLIPKFLAYSILPEELLLRISKQLLPYLNQFLPGTNIIWQTPVDYIFDITTISVGIAMLIILWKLLNKSKKALLISSFLIIFSVVLIIPLGRYFIYPDSRYLYTASIGVAMVLAVLIKNLYKSSTSKKILLSIPLVFVFVANIYFLRLKVNSLVKDGILRKSVISKVNSIIPKLGEKTLILADSTQSFYGISKNIFPFQSGFGQILLVNFFLNRQIPPEFFNDDFLWDIKAEGYKQYGSSGFGFFYFFDELMKAQEANFIPLDDIYGLSFVGSSCEVVDFSKNLRGEIIGKETSKIPLNNNLLQVKASNNSDYAYLAIDGKRETFWGSQISYNIPQFYEIDLGGIRKVVQVQIDSFENQDQNEVGYSILFSLDGKNWEEVFRDERRIPNENGLVNIFLLPKNSRFVKIQQIGYHEYAQWVIHELKIYEVEK